MKFILYSLLILWLSYKSKMEQDDGLLIKFYERGKMMGYVVGGVEVPISMYPHVATIIMNKHYLCGGSIVSERVILTAAHCVVAQGTFSTKVFGPEAFIVLLGSAVWKGGARYEVCKAVPHERYDRQSYFYDIAVLMLRQRIKFGPSIRKVEIAPHNMWRNEKYSFTLAGFGLSDSPTGVTERLLATRLHYVNSKTCNQSQSSSTMVVPDHMFCLIGQRWTSDCYGDSGSGIIWKRYIVGLVSTGRDTFCGADMMPSMYTDVSYFRKWIKSKIRQARKLSRPKHCPRGKESPGKVQRTVNEMRNIPTASEIKVHTVPRYSTVKNRLWYYFIQT